MPPDLSQPGRYAFGEFVLDTRRAALLRNNTEIKLRPQSHAVLRVLLARAGQLVTKEALHQAVWGDKVVTQDSLTHCIIDIRRALGDSDKRLLRTVPRQGFLLETRVEQLGSSDQRTQSPAPEQVRAQPWRKALWLVPLLVPLLVLGWLVFQRQAPTPTDNDNSVAVLPFKDLSAEQTQQHIGNGLSEDILNTLAANADLRVIARTSSFSMAEQASDIAEIRDALNVAYVVDGTIRASNNSLKVTAQLIRTQDSSNVWSETFAIDVAGLDTLQRSIASEVIQRVLPGTEVAEKSTSARQVTANEAMLLARYYENEVRDQPEVDQTILAEAIRLYRDATIAEPGSAVAHARLASAQIYAGDMAAAEVAIFRALTLDPNLSEVQGTLGRFYWIRGLPGAGAAWKRATEINPNNADALSSYGYWLWLQGNGTRPEGYFRRALELDPLSLSRYAALGNFYAHEAREAEALQIVTQVQAQFDGAAAFRLIARLLELIGRVDEGIAWTLRARNAEPDNAEHVAALAELFADLGDNDTVTALQPEPGVGLLVKMRSYERAIELGEDLLFDNPDDMQLRYLLAFAYLATDAPRLASQMLQSTGLPDTVVPEIRQGLDIEGLVSLIVADSEQEFTDDNRVLANWWIEKSHSESRHWWIQLYLACPLAVVGEQRAALDRIARLKDSPRLPWLYLLLDYPCFRDLQREPEYLEAIADVEARRTALREKLPATLARFNVSLVHSPR